MDMQEHRGSHRWQINWQAKVRVGDKEHLTDCHINDINLKGLRFTLTEQLAPDTFINLSLILTGDFVLNVEAWVAWHKTTEGLNTYGLYFNKIREADKERIGQFIQKNFPEEINRQWQSEAKQEKGGERMQDKRIFERFPARFPLRFLDLKENKESDAEVFDVSAKGLGMVTREQLRPNSTLEMWLKIPDNGDPLYARGQVVWSRPQGLNAYRTGINLERANMMGLSRALRVAEAY
ncbi:MAG: PilZ domain-containing protein [Candidatus Omnitrophica bacterium]|nr:PilZ domain-containing protein [Candidatus Omnitrophota bacterium]